MFNKAYDILTQTDVESTDPPEQQKLVLSQLQYVCMKLVSAYPHAIKSNRRLVNYGRNEISAYWMKSQVKTATMLLQLRSDLLYSIMEVVTKMTLISKENKYERRDVK